MNICLLKLSNKDTVFGIFEKEDENYIYIRSPKVLIFLNDNKGQEEQHTFINFLPVKDENIIVPFRKEQIITYLFEEDFNQDLLRIVYQGFTGLHLVN